MMKLFLHLFDIVFPPSADALLVKGLSEFELTRLFRYEATALGHAIASYKQEVVRALIHEAKFQGNVHAFRHLRTLFDLYVVREMPEIDIVVPIPLSSHRERMRGYNQVARVLQGVHFPPQTALRTDCLRRVRDTRPQTELQKQERLHNLRGAFSVHDASAVRGKRVLLVDDVSTTGATLTEAKCSLMHAGAQSVSCVALAH